MPRTIKVPNATDLYVPDLERELQSMPGFTWSNWNAAAQYALGAGRAEQAVVWAEAAPTALWVFEKNAELHPDQWPVHVGLKRGLSPVGLYEEALAHAEKALAQAPDDNNRQSLTGAIERLKAGQDVNQAAGPRCNAQPPRNRPRRSPRPMAQAPRANPPLPRRPCRPIRPLPAAA